MKQAIEEKVNSVRGAMLAALDADEPLVIVKAPPGSGKTRLILEAAAFLRNRSARVSIAAQTNSQADSICARLGRDFPFEVSRFYAATSVAPEDLGSSVSWVDDKRGLPRGPCIAVGTTAKWGLVDLEDPFDWLLIDEAWQMAEADFMLLRQVAPRFVMVGDPGQIPPTVTIDTARWATAPTPPHRPAPELLLAAEEGPELVELALPATWRLPPDSAQAINAFYDFQFEAWAQPGDRTFAAAANAREPIDLAIDLLGSGSMAAVTLPTPPQGPPLEEDREIAELAAHLATRLIERGGDLQIDGSNAAITASDIGLSATHRNMNARMSEALPATMASQVMVDTPERWQGLERPLMIIVHPVSGVTEPSAFDLETGRLCVMASRHEVGLIVVTRDHLTNTLDDLTPQAEQHVGLADLVGQGHARHQEFWEQLRTPDRVIAL